MLYKSAFMILFSFLVPSKVNDLILTLSGTLTIVHCILWSSVYLRLVVIIRGLFVLTGTKEAQIVSILPELKERTKNRNWESSFWEILLQMYGTRNSLSLVEEVLEGLARLICRKIMVFSFSINMRFLEIFHDETNFRNFWFYDFLKFAQN